MKTDNVIQIKSYAFAVTIVKLCQELQKEREFVLSRQILRNVTAVGALVEEAIGAQSDKDFYHKLTIGYKEARETKYWLRLLIDTSYISENAGEFFFVTLKNCYESLAQFEKLWKKD